MGFESLCLSCVIPCYNEEPVLRANLDRSQRILDSTKLTYEVILVDDGSEDGTVGIIEDLSRERSPQVRRLLHEQNMGRGKALTDGIRMAQGRIVGTIDIDLQTDAPYLLSLVQGVEDGADMVIAKRIYKIGPRNFLRWILSKGYKGLVHLFFGFPVIDSESGCKCFNRASILPILEQTESFHWFWDTEIVLRSMMAGLEVREHPSLFTPSVSGRSTVKIIRDTIYYLVNLVNFRFQFRRVGGCRDAVLYRQVSKGHELFRRTRPPHCGPLKEDQRSSEGG